jgi:hypothetical protein
MKTKENAAGAKKRSIEAFTPNPLKGIGALDLLYLMRKAEPATPQSERFDDNDQRAHGKTQSWHAFQTP